MTVADAISAHPYAAGLAAGVTAVVVGATGAALAAPAPGALAAGLAVVSAGLVGAAKQASP
jgi:hypothetical protein